MNKTDGLKLDITVETSYMEQDSNPAENRYLFAYTVIIHNRGTQSAMLLNRHWLVTDSDGDQQEVSGESVGGEQPLLLPDKSYQYSSGTVLKTPVGSMQGSYEMLTEAGNYIRARIAPFSLAIPRVLN